MVFSVLWPYHAALMTLGFVMMTTGMLIARYLKTRQGWLKMHKAAGISGVLFAIPGLFMAIYMVSVSTGLHFAKPHTYLGAITIILVGVTPVLGYAQLTVRSKSAAMSTIHRWAGRITLAFMVVTIVSGLLLVGIVS